MGLGASLGPSKVGKIRDTYGRLLKNVVFLFESDAHRRHHARTKRVLFLTIEGCIWRFAGFSAVEKLNSFRCSWRFMKIRALFLVPFWVQMDPRKGSFWKHFGKLFPNFDLQCFFVPPELYCEVPDWCKSEYSVKDILQKWRNRRCKKTQALEIPFEVQKGPKRGPKRDQKRYRSKLKF